MQASLAKLGCSEFAFSKIVSGITGKNRIAEAFENPTKSLDGSTADKLLEKISQNGGTGACGSADSCGLIES
jgi:hypothetical protein